MTRNHTLALALVLVMTAAPTLAAGAPDRTIPRQAPETKFRTLEGKTVSLSDYKGKVVLLDFWATWCGPCRMEMPTLQKLHDDLESKGVVVLGISLDKNPPVQVPPFLKKLGITYPNLADNPKDPSSVKWPVEAIPSLFLLDRKQQVVRQWRGVTPEGVLKTAIEEVLARKK
jgi:thiol-disulfide isomerase/thioredoxin